MPQKLRVQPSVGEAAADSLTVVWSGGLTADAMKDVSHFSLQWRTLTAGDLADERRAKLAALLADPATGGDLDQRLSYLAGLMSSDRVSLAFVVDIALFSVWQAYLINELDEDAPAACKFVPFWGLGAWLLL